MGDEYTNKTTKTRVLLFSEEKDVYIKWMNIAR